MKWLAGVRFAGQFIAWAITLVVIRILKPSDYGLMAIAEVLIGFAALFQELGLYSAMVQKRDLTERQVEQAFGFLIIANTGIYVLLFAMAPLLAAFFDDPRLTNIVRVLGIQFPLASIGVVQDAMLSRSMRFKQKSLATLAITLVNGITTLGFALAGAGVWALVYGSLAGSLIRPVALSLAARHWCRPRFSRAGMAEMLNFGGFITASGFIWYVYSQSDVFIIGKVLGKEILGFYSIAMQLASLPLQKIGETLNQVGLAAYSSIQHDMAAIRFHYLKVLRLLNFFGFPIFWGLSSIAPELVSVVLGARWERAVIPLQLLSLVMPLRLAGHSGSPLSAIGKPQVGTLNHLIALILMPPAFLIGAYLDGLVGVSMAWVVMFPIVTLIRLRFSLRPLSLNNRDYFKTMAAPAAASAVMYIMVILARHTIVDHLASPAIGLAFLVATGAVVYCAYMWLFHRKDCREIIALTKR
ncbi:lipopolysaccharide biosynthesis protein [Rhodanobacter sp. AS-Z3]|uniref:lipopolysaccharide biosynthesis protein n=1 Tax=Rhodanobacter sp. AS-Z3 TaxID=3031330 RepID=UPI002478980D|nr:lipopolysaccharide biosynthesis protein [Rhodanobacter sp. AS-Z3]WEN15366.1 lipopolysaccharide biosynthesis protein [Rhodanobacter sp. AS-Z3]